MTNIDLIDRFQFSQISQEGTRFRGLAFYTYLRVVYLD